MQSTAVQWNEVRRSLEEVGFEPNQAEALVDMVRKREQRLATKDDMAVLNVDVSTVDALRQEVRDRHESLRQELHARIDALDSSVNARIDALDSSVNARIDALDSSVNARIDALDSNLSGRMETLSSTLNGRMDALEGSLTGRMDGLEGQLTTIKWFLGAMLAMMTPAAAALVRLAFV